MFQNKKKNTDKKSNLLTPLANQILRKGTKMGPKIYFHRKIVPWKGIPAMEMVHGRSRAECSEQVDLVPHLTGFPGMLFPENRRVV